jgi:hypothetical protein
VDAIERLRNVSLLRKKSDRESILCMQHQYYLSSPTTICLQAEIGVLARLLKLSAGDLLGLAREVAENGALRCVQDLTRAQSAQLVKLLEFLAAPCCV